MHVHNNTIQCAQSYVYNIVQLNWDLFLWAISWLIVFRITHVYSIMHMHIEWFTQACLIVLWNDKYVYVIVVVCDFCLCMLGK